MFVHNYNKQILHGEIIVNSFHKVLYCILFLVCFLFVSNIYFLLFKSRESKFTYVVFDTIKYLLFFLTHIIFLFILDVRNPSFWYFIILKSIFTFKSAMMSMMNTPAVQPTVNNHNRNEEIPSLKYAHQFVRSLFLPVKDIRLSWRRYNTSNQVFATVNPNSQNSNTEKRVLITQLEKYSTDAETLEEQITEVQRKLVETENLLDTTQKQITSAEGFMIIFFFG